VAIKNCATRNNCLFIDHNQEHLQECRSQNCIECTFNLEDECPCVGCDLVQGE